MLFGYGGSSAFCGAAAVSFFTLLTVLVCAADDGIIIRGNGDVVNADAQHTTVPSPQSSPDGAVVIRRGGERTPPAALGTIPVVLSNAPPINLDLQNADIHNVLRLFASVSDVNIVTSDGVQGTVTVRLEDVPWDLALAAVLQSTGLSATVMAPNIVVVEPQGQTP